MRRLRPIILLSLAILAFVQNIFWSEPSFAEVPLRGPFVNSFVNSFANSSVAHENLESFRLRGIELERTYSVALSKLVESIRPISPLLSERIKENFFGLNWYFASLDHNKVEERARGRVSGDIWIDQQQYLLMTQGQRQEFFLKNILIYEFQRTHGQRQMSDEAKLEKVLEEILNSRATVDSLGNALDQADLLQNDKQIWYHQLFLQDPSLANNQLDGVLFSRKGLRFLMRHCEREALFDIRARQLESQDAVHFAGLNVLLERLSRSGVCASVDHKLYTIPLKAAQTVENKIRLDLKHQRQDETPIFLTSWFAWIGTFELVLNSEVIRIVRQPALKRFVYEIIIGGALSGAAAVSYEFYQNKKAPAELLSTQNQLKLLADLNRALVDSPIGYYKMQTSEFLSQTQKNLSELAGHGFLEMVMLKKAKK
jgi:hypothetical protein